jgi:Peptidase_C39 like family
MDVPFSCQRELAVPAGALSSPAGISWAERGCAIACVTMVLNYHGRRASMADVLSAALARQAFDPVRGWRHTRLVEVLQAYGLTAYRRNWRLLDGHEADYLAGRAASGAVGAELALVRRQMLAEGVWRIGSLLAEQVPVVVSTYRPPGDRSSIGHQLVLVALDADEVVYHDPAQEAGAFLRCGLETFLANWKGTAIVAHDGWEPQRQ